VKTVFSNDVWLFTKCDVSTVWLEEQISEDAIQ
jgi:hypothetical protein